ncbi:hypothetical protein PUNSTDRAFT_99948 [Punctularia strigosozonata HHB-11173 SS5]|uniref:uncharacterized protein n=1 Tax=Punctularia strigosozonata (strain HHB-11173) TaxID=741275 RepID=UPI0004416C5A|nr:uncharacterized protein PUNSTDRAFT_99948 [Punctularia strigosozonata HHB-11173 SS5]EIN10431.1 hypothetical protein PUNSTDRAFT_99948 [Punctularia strigosozonata HHB-11173 SS5]
MPSVRIKRSHDNYASLRDDPAPAPNRRRSRTLTELFAPGNASATDSPHADNATRRRADSASVPGPSGASNDGRPYSTFPRQPSRVTSHILRDSVRSARPPTLHEDRRQPPLIQKALAGSHASHERDQAGNYLLQGAQETIAMREDPMHSRVGSAVSLLSDESTHHEDEVVEHLDVIDPEIATVSNLANAANAIVIPPLSFYSRKPVVVLPKRSAPSRAENGEYTLDELDTHVEDVLTKKQQFKRIMRGVWAFCKTPIGFIVAIYGFLIVFWGTAIVLFLVKWINLHNSIAQGYWLELSQQVETGLFTLTSVGLIPWRVVDTYRITIIWWYKRKTRKLRKKAGLPDLYDEDDLPDPKYDVNYVHVLTEKQQRTLHYHQQQFTKSQTWYRPHGTETHRAFPINIALIICLLNDGNSIFQVGLSSVMWALNRFDRPAATTATLLPASFICGILSAVFIWIGSKRTRRTEKVEERLRTALNMEKSSNVVDEKPATQQREEVESPPELHGSVTSRDYVSDTPTRRRSREHSEDGPTATQISIPDIVIEEEITVPPHEQLTN